MNNKGQYTVVKISKDIQKIGKAIEADSHIVDWKKTIDKKSFLENYGLAAGLYEIWDTITSPYLVLSYGEHTAQLLDSDLEQLESGIFNALIARTYVGHSLQAHHRSLYYGTDFQELLEHLKQIDKACYDFVIDSLLYERELYILSGVYTKECFNAACSWVFSILKNFGNKKIKRFSRMQSFYVEHLFPYLWTFYFKYHKDKWKVLSVCIEQRETKDIWRYQSEESLADSRKQFYDYMNHGKVEEALGWGRSIPETCEDLLDIRNFCITYDRERRFQKYTQLDQTKDWTQLLEKKENIKIPAIKNRVPRALIFEWNSIGHKINVDALRNFGFECDSLRIPFTVGKWNDQCLWYLQRYMKQYKYDFVFSLNYQGIVAEVCDYYQIPYIAWCYDSPTFTGAHRHLYYPTTHVFLFDSDDAEQYRKAGVKQAYYLPLAVNIDFFTNELKNYNLDNSYKADISFVGSLYESKLPKAMQSLTDYQKGYLNALMDQQIDVYGHNFLSQVVTQEFAEWLSNPSFNQYINSEFNKDQEFEKVADTTPGAGAVQQLLNKQITNRERLLLLNLLAQYYQVNLYSYKENEALKGLNFCGTADYYTEMPHIFKNSKFNLNATLRSIQHGIPLRCLDIMACHGLLLTNYQKDFDDHFEDQKNLLFYTDAGEALEKVKFYMEHEDLRTKIAEAGYQTVKTYYDYPVKLRELFKMADLEYLMPEKERSL